MISILEKAGKHLDILFAVALVRLSLRSGTILPFFNERYQIVEIFITFKIEPTLILLIISVHDTNIIIVPV
jgi:hypothetical protein